MQYICLHKEIMHFKMHSVTTLLRSVQPGSLNSMVIIPFLGCGFFF